MKSSFRKLLLSVAFLACASIANAQLPNEKFGKPSNMEWDYVGWGDAVDADAIILCKTMNVTYQLSDQVANSNQAFSELGPENIDDFGKNQVDDGNILVKYEFRLRTKILKPEGAKHANIDITYFDLNDKKLIVTDQIEDLKVRVFTKNEKGKVEKKNIPTESFVKERVDDNYMVIHVVVPDVQPGSIIEYQYNITSPRPAYLYDWVFQESIPTVRSKCDINIPAFLQFNMNVPINKLIKPNVEVGHLTYDSNRTDMKKGKTCTTNHYTIVGDYILPKGHPLKSNAGDGAVEEEIAIFTSKIANPNVTVPASMPDGSTHLRVK
ncbi:MAG: DUF3857 domain-containing protein [Prevotella sp.]|nr:DUF3857 domain-containing protein [Prevotella sp.]